MPTREHVVDLAYTRQEILVRFALANTEYVDRGGYYREDFRVG